MAEIENRLNNKTMTTNKGGDTLNPKVDGNKFPKLAKATELANNYKIRAEKAEAESKKLKAKVEVKPSKKLEKKEDTDNLDYGQKAFLVANGIKGAEEHQLAIEVMKNSGKDLDEVIESKFFMSELKDLRTAKEINDATPPSDTSRPSSAPKDDVGFWVAKGEMPPNTPENQELRQKVVNAKMKSESGGSPFSNTPIVGGPTH